MAHGTPGDTRACEIARVQINGIAQKVAKLELESEATQLSAIVATIIRNMAARLEREQAESKRKKKRGGSNDAAT